MRATSTFLILVLGLLSFNTYSNKYTHNISSDVKIDYHQDGLVKIYSIDKGQQNHHFSLKLKSISNKKHHSVLDTPLSVSQVDNSIIYQWNENISDEWKLIDSNIVRKLTINKKLSIDDSNEKLIIGSYFKTDLDFLAVGMAYPYTFLTFNEGGQIINNLRIDETSFYIIDSNCKQFNLDKDFDYKNHKLDYTFDAKNIEYPITLVQEIKINNISTYDNSKYEREVAVDGNTLAISNQSQNIVNLYEKKNHNWHHVQTLAPEASNELGDKGSFGTKLALSNNTLAIAAYDDIPVNACRNCGVAAVYLYKKINTQWIKQARLVAPYKPNKNGYGMFGSSLGIYKDSLVVGDNQRIHNFTGKNREMLGAVYVFKEGSNKWRLEQAILPKGNDSDFGKSVAINKNTLIIGGIHSGNYAGKIIDIKEKDYGQFYIYHYKNNNWHKQSQIKITDLIKKNEYYDSTFADSIDISSNTIVIGNPLSNNLGVRGYNRNSNYKNSLYDADFEFDHFGQVYVFKKQGSRWKKRARLQAPNPLQLDHFGQSVKIINDTLVIGAYGDSSNSIGINGANDNCQLPSSGAVYVYEKKWNGWKQNAYIKSDKPEKLELFGQKIDSDGETIIVNSNDVYIFNKTDDSWKKVNRIKSDQIKHSK